MLRFFINKKETAVDACLFPPEYTLNEYLRNNKHLTGTKSMCFEGGCGACLVSVEKIDPISKTTKHFAVNSCLVSIFSCNNWHIETIEGIGNPIEGYNPIQKALAACNGSQCGFCSPGMVMNMYSLKKQGEITEEKIEDSFGGNMCRCTGYRPILKAFRNLPEENEAVDIEDIFNSNLTHKPCLKKNNLLELKRKKWIKVFDLNDLLKVLKKYVDDDYMLVSGNTAKGVYPPEKFPDVYIDVSDVEELVELLLDESKVVVGGNVTLNALIKFFNDATEKDQNFNFLKKVTSHLKLVANIPVRNIGTVAGNLMIKYKHNEFPSDIFLLLETIGATLTIIDVNKKITTISPEEFLSFNMKGRVILSISIPARDSSYLFGSYKIMARAQNTHAIVSAGFLFQLENQSKVKEATIVYGNINSQFVHAKNTETILLNKDLFNNDNLQLAYATLDDELLAEDASPDPPPERRKAIAIALFYKFILSVAPEDKVCAQYRSGGKELERELSEGSVEFGTDVSEYPLTQPLVKLEALAQTSGTAEYIYDIPEFPNQLYGAFVTANARVNSVIEAIDTSEALGIKEVVAYLDKNDITGENILFEPDNNSGVLEELFCSGTVRYYHQPIGLILATTQKAAELGAKKVKVTFKESTQKPLLKIRDVLNSQNDDRLVLKYDLKPANEGNNVQHIIKGTFDIYSQYHYSMETQITVVRTTEDGLEMYAGTQWMDTTQATASRITGIPANKINVSVRRLGGAYGCKIDRHVFASTAAALAAYKFRKPVRIWMPFTKNMDMIGKRFPNSADYEVAVDGDGVVQYLKMKDYQDIGYGTVLDVSYIIYDSITSCYDTTTWDLQIYSVITDKHPNTSTRAPGSTEGEALMESIMDHIAYELGADPLQVRLKNLSKDRQELLEYIEELKKWADVDNRMKEIEKYNRGNRWMKKGMSVVPMVFELKYAGCFGVIVSIYHSDGSVAVAHAGIEIGQGINTKVAQVCANALGLPLNQVSIKPSNTLVSPNAGITGGSLTTEVVSYAVQRACKILLARIQPFKEMNPTASWPELIEICFENNVDLSATWMFSPDEVSNPEYLIYGVCATEVIVDILTGRHQILRVDILEDVGKSLNPLIDIGQVEGAFTMGLGYHLMEKIEYNEDGRLLTNRTWNYTPPGAKDIPINFRIKFPKNNPNPDGVLHTKAIGEPPLCLSVSVPLAIRRAVSSAREQADQDAPKWYSFDGPSTVDHTFMNSLNTYIQYTL